MTDIGWKFDNSYTQLSQNIMSRTLPTKVKSPKIVIVNYELAKQLGLDFSSLNNISIAPNPSNGLVTITKNNQTTISKINVFDINGKVVKIIDSELCTLPVELIVIDNASELTLPKHPKVSVIQQANLGGAGGFGRGILEAFEGSRDFSHVLLMDDDIDIELSSIHRLYNLLRYTNPDHMSCFGGAMLDRFLPEMLYECGADQVNDKGKINHIKPTLSNLDLNTFESLDKIAVKKPSDYGAWWFFCFSRQAFKNVGMPMPCFIRGDDKEYGLRLKKNGYATDFPPGIGVWHEPFYAKHDGWLKYFDLYNALVTAALGRFANSSLCLPSCCPQHRRLRPRRSAGPAFT
mgnify:CR=1 FL=1